MLIHFVHSVRFPEHLYPTPSDLKHNKTEPRTQARREVSHIRGFSFSNNCAARCETSVPQQPDRWHSPLLVIGSEYNVVKHKTARLCLSLPPIMRAVLGNAVCDRVGDSVVLNLVIFEGDTQNSTQGGDGPAKFWAGWTPPPGLALHSIGRGIFQILNE